MDFQTKAEIIDQFRNLYLNKDLFYEFFDGYAGSIEEQEDPSEIEPLNLFFKANNYGVNIAYALLFENLELSKGQENLLNLTFKNLCEYFDVDPDSDAYEDLADVISASAIN